MRKTLDIILGILVYAFLVKWTIFDNSLISAFVLGAFTYNILMRGFEKYG